MMKIITDFESLNDNQIHTVIYYEKDVNNAKFVEALKPYNFVYIRLSNTEEDFASNWVLGEYVSSDNEFDADDIP